MVKVSDLAPSYKDVKVGDAVRSLAALALTRAGDSLRQFKARSAQKSEVLELAVSLKDDVVEVNPTSVSADVAAKDSVDDDDIAEEGKAQVARVFLAKEVTWKQMLGNMKPNA
jgi:hypothetical protein